MSATVEEIEKYVVDRANEVWREEKRPYYVSLISPELRSRGINYKDLIGQQRLIDYIKGLHEVLTVVSHPTQKTKIGVVPKGEHFEFIVNSEGSGDKSTEATLRTSRPFSSRYAAINFIQALSRLPPEEIEKVHIPLSVLAKMMSEK